MAYTKTVWQVEEGVNLNRFAKSSESTDYVTLSRAPSSITQAGTTFSVANMNNIEDGIETLDNTVTSYLDQAVLTTSSPVFAGLGVTGATTFGSFVTVAGNVYKNTDSSRMIIGGGSAIGSSYGGYLTIEGINYGGSGLGGGISLVSTNGKAVYIPAYNTVIGGTADNGVDKLQVNGSISADSINTDNVAIKHKFITGTLDSSAIFNSLHGLDGTKIISISGVIYSGSGERLDISTLTGIYSGYFLCDSTVLSVNINSSTYDSYSVRILITYQG